MTIKKQITILLIVTVIVATIATIIISLGTKQLINLPN